MNLIQAQTSAELKTRLFLVSVLLLASVFAFSAPSALAQVTLRMVGDDADRSRHYVDVDRVVIGGDIRSFWRTVDLPQKDFAGAMSLRHRQEINCKEGTIRTIVTSHHQGLRGTGAIIITLPAQDQAFQPIFPDNIDSRLETFVCKGQFAQRVLKTKSAKPVDADGNPIPEEEKTK